MIPNKFKLFQQTWQIRNSEHYELEDSLGECRPDQHEILLNPNQNQESLIHTLLHECVHAIEQKQHLELTERQVDLIALGVLNLFRSNPEMISLLQIQE